MRQTFRLHALGAFITGTLIFGCATTQTTSDLNYPLEDVQKAVGARLPGGIQTVSSNQRTFQSEFFAPDRLIPDYDQSHKHHGALRAKARVTILGDRRPYRAEVLVDLQERINEKSIPRVRKTDLSLGQFERISADPDLARRIASDIQEYLLQKAGTKNILDDFKPF